MIDREQAVKDYEKLIADKVRKEEELAQIRDKILLAQRELKELEGSKEKYAQFQIDHQKALDEIEQKKQEALAEIDRHKENTGRIVDQQLARAEAKDQESSQREKNIADTEKRQHQKGIEQAANDEWLEQEHTRLFHREVKIEKQKKQHKQYAEKNGLDLSHVEQRQKEVNAQQTQVNAEALANAETLKGIQGEYANQEQERQKIKAREEAVADREQKATHHEEDLDGRESGINARETKLDARSQALDKKDKDLNDKDKNLRAEQEDLAFKQAQLNAAYEKARRDKVINL